MYKFIVSKLRFRYNGSIKLRHNKAYFEMVCRNHQAKKSKSVEICGKSIIKAVVLPDGNGHFTIYDKCSQFCKKLNICVNNLKCPWCDLVFVDKDEIWYHIGIARRDGKRDHLKPF